MENYLTGRHQRVVLNCQSSSWKNTLAVVPQGSVLEPLRFLIYINDLPNRIESICKIFADDTSLFSKVKEVTFSDTQLNNDLNKISKCAFQWKMLFNLDPSKQAIEICFSHKHDSENYPSLVPGVVVITTAQLNLTKPELRFCAGSNPARGLSEIRDGEDQWSRLEIRLNAFCRSTIPQKQFFIIIVIIITKVQLANSQKHLGLILDSKLDFNEHIGKKINKCNKIIGIMKRHFLRIREFIFSILH